MMSINLVKGGNTSLQGLSNVIVGLGWDPSNDVSGVTFDLDAAALMLGSNDKLQNPKDFVFFHNLTSPCGSVVHLGDSRSGEGDGDDEQIQVNLATLPPNIAKIVFAIQIYDASKFKLNFGQVDNSFVRVVDMGTGNEVCSALTEYELQEDFSTADSVIIGEIYKRNSEWKFRAVGKGYSGGYAKILELYR